MTAVDIVLISNTLNVACRKTTERALSSLFESEPSLDLRVFMVEQQASESYDKCTMLYPVVPFNYNHFCNLGREAGSAPVVALCNNDLLFHPGWLSAMLPCLVGSTLSASPNINGKIKKPARLFGRKVGRILHGCCIVQQRKIYDIIGKLDTRKAFWDSDNLYRNQLLEHRLSHMLVRDSRVDHLESATLCFLPKDLQLQYCKKDY